MNNTTVVYTHIRLDDNTIFYVGIGNSKRPYDKRARSKFWNNIVNKAGYKVDIIYTDLSWKEACNIEKLLISKHGRKDLNTGCLCNLTDGGEGAFGVIVSKKTRCKLSKVKKGKKQSEDWIKNRANSLRGNKLSEEHKTKLSIRKLGISLTKSHKENISKALQNSNTPPGAKKVLNVITNKVYKSAMEASKYSDLSYTAFRAQLSGQNKNRTNFKYLEHASE